MTTLPLANGSQAAATATRHRTVLHNGRECIMPRHVQIESVGGKGMCTARCTMCTIEDWQKPPRIMQQAEFEKFVLDLAPYREHIDYVTLHCNGEPLMDKRLHDKVAFLKQRGFRGTGFATNCTLLDERRAQALLAAGLDTIICSIDGATKAVHESIRHRTNFDTIVQNVERFLALRNERAARGLPATRVLVRFILQDKNRHEWDAYQAFWRQRLDPERGDGVLQFPVHNWGGQMENWRQNLELYGAGQVFECEDLYERLIVFSDGQVSHCDADYNGFFPHGSVFEAHFLDIYNGPVFTRYREAMAAGKLCELEHCNSCSIPLARAQRRSS